MERTLFVRAEQTAHLRFLCLGLMLEMSTGLQPLECARAWETNWHPARFQRRNDYKSGRLPSARVARIDYRE